MNVEIIIVILITGWVIVLGGGICISVFRRMNNDIYSNGGKEQIRGGTPDTDGDTGRQQF